MKTAYFLGISPLGPYQYKMIAEDVEGLKSVPVTKNITLRKIPDVLGVNCQISVRGVELVMKSQGKEKIDK